MVEYLDLFRFVKTNLLIEKDSSQIHHIISIIFNLWGTLPDEVHIDHVYILRGLRGVRSHGSQGCCLT